MERLVVSFVPRRFWSRGRIMAPEAQEKGEFATVVLMPPGRKLRINALTRRAGSILIEAAAIDTGAPFPGRSFADADPIQGDQYRTPVTWKGNDDLGSLDGDPVIPRFRMDKARLFGLDFE